MVRLNLINSASVNKAQGQPGTSILVTNSCSKERSFCSLWTKKSSASFHIAFLRM
jgi:hypothetical protein